MGNDPIVSEKVGPTPLAASTTIPDHVQKKIRNAWIVAFVVGASMLSLSLLAFAGTAVLGFTALELFDAMFVFGVAFGIYRGSRTCALLMLVYFTLVGYVKIHLAIEAGFVGNWAYTIAVICSIYCLLGVVGTFQYQRIIRARMKSTSKRV